MVTPYVLPELKASQPHQSTNVPMTALTGFPKGRGAVPWAYLPSRGPSIKADANADAPPVELKLVTILKQQQNYKSTV